MPALRQQSEKFRLWKCYGSDRPGSLASKRQDGRNGEGNHYIKDTANLYQGERVNYLIKGW